MFSIAVSNGASSLDLPRLLLIVASHGWLLLRSCGRRSGTNRGGSHKVVTKAPAVRTRWSCTVELTNFGGVVTMTTLSLANATVGVRARSTASSFVADRRRHALAWFGGDAALAFAVSFVGADLLAPVRSPFIRSQATAAGNTNSASASTAPWATLRQASSKRKVAFAGLAVPRGSSSLRHGSSVPQDSCGGNAAGCSPHRLTREL